MTRLHAASGGFTLVEVIVATALLATIALGLTSTLVAAQRGRAQSEQSMYAVQLAAEGLEQLRAGQSPRDTLLPGFTRIARATSWSGHPGLDQLEVSMSWNDGVARTLHLSTLARHAR